MKCITISKVCNKNAILNISILVSSVKAENFSKSRDYYILVGIKLKSHDVRVPFRDVTSKKEKWLLYLNERLMIIITQQLLSWRKNGIYK